MVFKGFSLFTAAHCQDWRFAFLFYTLPDNFLEAYCKPLRNALSMVFKEFSLFTAAHCQGWRFALFIL